MLALTAAAGDDIASPMPGLTASAFKALTTVSSVEMCSGRLTSFEGAKADQTRSSGAGGGGEGELASREAADGGIGGMTVVRKGGGFSPGAPESELEPK